MHNMIADIMAKALLKDRFEKTEKSVENLFIIMLNLEGEQCSVNSHIHVATCIHNYY